MVFKQFCILLLKNQNPALFMFRMKLKAFKLVKTFESKGARNWRGKERKKNCT